MKNIIFIALCLFVMSLTAFGQDGLRRDLDATFKRYELVNLNKQVVLEKAQSERPIEIQAYGRRFEFVLTPNDLRAPNYRAVETGISGEREMPPAEIITYKGKLAGDENSEVRFTITRNEVEGLIYTGNNEKFFVSEAEKFSGFARQNDAVVYQEGDLERTIDLSNDTPLPQNATVEDQINQGLDLLQPQMANAAAPEAALQTVEVATEADLQWVNQAGGASAANNEILSILNLVDGIYRRDLNLSVTVTYQHVWTTSDPYSSASTSAELDSFLNYWNTNFPRSQYPRDTAHLFTGKFSNQGIAYQGVVCRSANYAYGLTARSGSVNHFITAHEIGHNLGAEHVDNSGSCANSIMNPTLTYNATAFCEISKSQVSNYVASYGTCLTASTNPTPTPTPTVTPTPTPTATPTATPTPSCNYQITPASQNFSATGGTGTVTVTTTSGCTWTANSNQNFASIVSGFSGSGSGTVTYSVSTNTSSNSRSAIITIAGLQHSIFQSGATSTNTYTLSATPSTVNPGGQVTVSWSAPSGAAYADWIGLFRVGTSNYSYVWWSYTNGQSSGSFTVTLPTTAGQYEFRYMTNNTFNSVQTSNIITVGTGGGTPTPTPTATPTATPTPTPTVTPTPTPTPSCSYQITPVSQNFSAAGGTGSVNVTAPAGCAWTANSNQSFVTIVTGFSGSGSGTVTYSVAANAGSTTRSAAITIANLQHNVQQAAASTNSNYTLVATPVTVSTGGQVTINWTAPYGSPYSDWIGLFKVGSSNYNYVWWNYTQGASSGRFTINVPSEPGQYEFRYMSNNTFNVVQTSNIITVSSGVAALTENPEAGTAVFTANALAINGDFDKVTPWYASNYQINSVLLKHPTDVQNYQNSLVGDLLLRSASGKSGSFLHGL